MGAPWRPDREVSVAEATLCARAAGLVGEDVRIIASGWDNTIVLVDEAWVFRFPRREIALPGIDREIAHLPLLAPDLSLDVPVPEIVGTFGEPPWPFWAARHLPGTELALSAHADRMAVATAIGTFLAGLHARPLPADLPVDPFDRADAVTRAVRARDVLADLDRLGLYSVDSEVESVLADAATAGPPKAPLVLSHGDLYSRHVLVDASGRASAVIDWGDLCAAPASVDLAIAWSAFTGDVRAALLHAYGPIDDDTALRARVMAIFSAASVAHYAHDTGDEVLLRHSLAGLAGVAR